MLIIQYTIPNVLPTNLTCISDSKTFLEVCKRISIEWSTITDSITSKYPSSHRKPYRNQHYCQRYYHQNNKQSCYEYFTHPGYTHVSRHGTFALLEPLHR